MGTLATGPFWISKSRNSQNGIHLPNIKARSGIGQRTVALIMRDATEFLPAKMSVQQAVASVPANFVP